MQLKARHLKARADARTVPITPLARARLEAWLRRQTVPVRAWLGDTGFTAEPGSVALVPGERGVAGAVAGIGAEDDLWDWAAVAEALPAGRYRIDARLGAGAAGRAALGWGLAGYRFDRYRETDDGFADLVWPRGCDRAAVERAVGAVHWVRDLINTPASDMGPAELAQAARRLARRHGARCRVVAGAALERAGYPSVLAVGRASPRAPRLIDLAWGDPGAPKVSLVGKGVCFDSGGLDLKSAAQMKLMKKDMGGAAQVLGLAHMIMAAGLHVRLRVLVPAVENSVSGSAMRPLDVVRTGAGISVEIGNTDAEGRLVLADALAAATAEQPDLLIDCATLTGAARIALGTEVPALFCNDDGLAGAILSAARATSDPLWRMPLWAPYRRHIEGWTADLTNAPDDGLGGAITAALFLQEFVAASVKWAHIDLMAWNPKSRPGRPQGGEAMGVRALYGMIAKRYSG